MLMQCYIAFKNKHIPGKNNYVSDEISRRQWKRFPRFVPLGKKRTQRQYH